MLVSASCAGLLFYAPGGNTGDPLKKLYVTLLLLTQIVSAVAATKHITSPKEAFGFEPGTDRKLADWVQLTTYFRTIAGQSDRIQYNELGKTTEGRPFISLTISAPENLQHAAQYQEIVRKLGDPRTTSPDEAKRLAAQGKTILVVTCNVHSTEIASSQSATQFAYRLATENTPEIQNILHNVIIVLVPSLNPDGEQLVVDWYKKYLGTPFEGSSPVVLYHHYVGHDDNRDWAIFSQVETQLAVDKVINAWRPQILYDLHQMGSFGPRVYLPPWVDPIDPNIDPLLTSTMNALGANTALEVAQTGKQGVLIHGVYDLWSPARHYMAYHGTARILTESASVNIASPIEIPFEKLDRGIGYDAKVASWNFPDPWKGGTWRLGDIVAYQQDAFFSIARNAAINRERYLNNFYTIHQHAVAAKGAPYAYIVPAEQKNPLATVRLVNILRFGLVEVQQATADFEAGGQHYPRGSYIVPLAQPYGPFAKTLLEVQHYPDLREYPSGPPQRPYDVTAQTLPLLFGVDAVAVAERFSVATSKVGHAEVAPTTLSGDAARGGYLLANEGNGSFYALWALLRQGVSASRVTAKDATVGVVSGDIYLPQQPGLKEKLEPLVGKYALRVRPLAAPLLVKTMALKLPRIALYQSWVPSMDEGWTRFLFDQNGIPYTRVVDADIRNGHLAEKFDVVLIPDSAPRALTEGRTSRGDDEETGPQIPPEFRGGLGPEGLKQLETFAEAGGTLITLNKASQVYAKHANVNLQNVLEGVPSKDFYIPGSILEINVNPDDPIGYGSAPSVPIWFEGGPTFQVSGPAHSVAHYGTDKPLLSGWILGGDKLKNTSALAEEPMGKGRLIAFGFRPQYRVQSEVSYRFLFNSLLYAAASFTQGNASQTRDGAPAPEPHDGLQGGSR